MSYLCGDGLLVVCRITLLILPKNVALIRSFLWVELYTSEPPGIDNIFHWKLFRLSLGGVKVGVISTIDLVKLTLKDIPLNLLLQEFVLGPDHELCILHIEQQIVHYALVVAILL